jgi:hypothetical protein
LRLLRIGEDKNSEGAALLTLIDRMWYRLHTVARRPWWIESWGARLDQVADRVAWPDDLQQRANEAEWKINPHLKPASE